MYKLYETDENSARLILILLLLDIILFIFHVIARYRNWKWIAKLKQNSLYSFFGFIVSFIVTGGAYNIWDSVTSEATGQSEIPIELLRIPFLLVILPILWIVFDLFVSQEDERDAGAINKIEGKDK